MSLPVLTRCNARWSALQSVEAR